MKMSKILLLIIILVIILGYGLITYLPMGGAVTEAVNPTDIKKISSEESPIPQTPAHNPPPEIKYDTSTDLHSELESINPQVQIDDFNELNAAIN